MFSILNEDTCVWYFMFVIFHKIYKLKNISLNIAYRRSIKECDPILENLLSFEV